MGKLFNEFIKSIQNQNTKKVLTSSYKLIGDYETSNKTLDDVKNIFYASKVDTPPSVRNLRSQFRNFAYFIDDQPLVQMLDSINEYEICAKVKELGTSKYFSHSSFQKTLSAINTGSIQNPFYVQTLFMCIYEGIYSRDFSVLSNLSASDICGNTVTCRYDNGTTYKIDISDDLVHRLYEMSTIDHWVSQNRFGIVERNIIGKAHDSCFKVKQYNISNRKSPPTTVYKNVYRRLLRELISTTLGYNIQGFEIYISGIMHRISTNLHSQGINLFDAFSNNNRDITVKQIIQLELDRCHYDKPIANFKQLIKGHLELFLPVLENSEQRNPYTQPDFIRLQDEDFQDYITYKNLNFDDLASLSTTPTGTKLPKKELVTIANRRVYPRDRSIAQKALQLANHECEIDTEHHTFISRSHNLPYMEPHHLIPLAFAENFDVSLDVVENVVSLCSNCHNKLHYGKNITSMLKWLYESRKTKLEQVGLRITFEDLLWMYDIID